MRKSKIIISIIEELLATPPVVQPAPGQVTYDDAKKIGDFIRVNWDKIDLEQFKRGIAIEQEHGSGNHQTDVTGDDLILAGKIALAHLKEIPDYYTRLDKMEKGAEE